MPSFIKASRQPASALNCFVKTTMELTFFPSCVVGLKGTGLRGNARGEDHTYVISKVRESFKPPSYPTRSDFAFGPEWALAGFAIGGETIAFDATPPNFIMITASNEAGSCPILYVWDARAAIWIRYGKVLHQAQTRVREASETVQFDGLVDRFRIAEEELERATIRQASLRLELDDGRTLTLRPEPQPVEQAAQQAADLVTELYANDEIEITFALPADLDAERVVHSWFTVSGYYDRYAALLSAAMDKARAGVNTPNRTPISLKSIRQIPKPPWPPANGSSIIFRGGSGMRCTVTSALPPLLL